MTQQEQIWFDEGFEACRKEYAHLIDKWERELAEAHNINPKAIRKI